MTRPYVICYDVIWFNLFELTWSTTEMSITCYILRFLQGNTFSFVHLLTQVDNWISHPCKVSISVNIIRHETKCLSSVNESGSPVISPFLWIRLVWVIKIQVGCLGQHNLESGKMMNSNWVIAMEKYQDTFTWALASNSDMGTSKCWVYYFGEESI